MSDLEWTLEAIQKLGWRVVLLSPRSKRPQGRQWTVLTRNEVPAIRRHLEGGGNLGLVCGPQSGVAVFDFDNPQAYSEMLQDLGFLQAWVETGSGKTHCYVQWEPDLPPHILWKGERVGEIQRGPALQHVVIPPSIHPDTGKPYRWLVKPQDLNPAPLPEAWAVLVKNEEYEEEGFIGTVPDYIKREAVGHPPQDDWDGLDPTEILRRAASQPGARRRRNGIKFQCPGCRAEGHDNSKDNAIVYNDGRWGCALSQDHSFAIGEALGAYDEPSEELTQKLLRSESVGDAMKKLKMSIATESSSVLKDVLKQNFK